MVGGEVMHVWLLRTALLMRTAAVDCRHIHTPYMHHTYTTPHATSRRTRPPLGHLATQTTQIAVVLYCLQLIPSYAVVFYCAYEAVENKYMRSIGINNRLQYLGAKTSTRVSYVAHRWFWVVASAIIAAQVRRSLCLYTHPCSLSLVPFFYILFAFSRSHFFYLPPILSLLVPCVLIPQPQCTPTKGRHACLNFGHLWFSLF